MRLWMAGLVLCGVACPGPGFDVSGDWHEAWSCQESCAGGAAQTLTGSVDMTLTQSGEAVTREDADGTTWTGTLDGTVLTLSTSSGDYSEESTFTFDDGATSFTLTSSYAAGGDCTGTCTGTGERR